MESLKIGADSIPYLLLTYMIWHVYYRHLRDKVEDAQFRAIARLLQKLTGETDDTWDEDKPLRRGVSRVGGADGK
jgi:hypothetical protein